MRGLLLKDWYMMMKCCRAYILLFVVYAVAAMFGGGSNIYWVFYVAMFLGMIPMTIYAYDERDDWAVYSLTHPHTRTRIASSKYVLSLCITAVGVALVAAVGAVGIVRTGTFVPETYVFMLALAAAAFTVPSSLTMPFMFALGAERGRIAYIVIVGAAVAVFSTFSLTHGMTAEYAAPVGGDTAQALPFNSSVGFGVSGVILAVAAALFVLSWLLSVALYNRRNL